MWSSARIATSRAALVETLATEGQRDSKSVSADIDQCVAGTLLVELHGCCDDDWQHVANLRPVPRVAIAVHEPNIGFRITAPDGQCYVDLDALTYLIWTFWDGALTVADAATLASETTGLSPRLLRGRSLALAVAAIRTGLVFFDAPHSS